MGKLVFILFVSLAILVREYEAVSSGTSVTSITGVNGFGYQAAVLCPIIMGSGALVSPQCVCTTATLVNGLQPTDIQITLGSPEYYSGGITAYVQTISMNPAFNTNTYESNIACLFLTAPVSATDMSTYSIAVIPLCTALPAPNAYTLVSAYGATDPNYDLPDYLQKAYLLMYPAATCTKYKPGRVTSTMFCAGDPAGNKDLCPGDQGAPLVYPAKTCLCGIYNWGCSCGLAAPNPSTPVFDSIPAFITWIQSVCQIV